MTGPCAHFPTARRNILVPGAPPGTVPVTDDHGDTVFVEFAPARIPVLRVCHTVGFFPLTTTQQYYPAALNDDKVLFDPLDISIDTFGNFDAAAGEFTSSLDGLYVVIANLDFLASAFLDDDPSISWGQVNVLFNRDGVGVGDNYAFKRYPMLPNGGDANPFGTFGWTDVLQLQVGGVLTLHIGHQGAQTAFAGTLEVRVAMIVHYLSKLPLPV